MRGDSEKVEEEEEEEDEDDEGIRYSGRAWEEGEEEGRFGDGIGGRFMKV